MESSDAKKPKAKNKGKFKGPTYKANGIFPPKSSTSVGKKGKSGK